MIISEILPIVFRSFYVSLSATTLASLIGLPVSLLLALKDFRFKRAVITFINSLLAVPAVAIGLLVYLFLSRNGPLGILGLLYTPWAMIIAQAILAFPIITALSLAALEGLSKKILETSFSLGATQSQMVLTLIKEARYPLTAGLIMGFSRVIGETGMTMMVGGNIKGSTRVMTTTIALETMKGNFELAIALGIILLCVAFLINILLQVIQGKAEA